MQASGSFMTGMRAFSAHLLPLISLLWPSTAVLRFFVYFLVNTRVSYLLDDVEDILR